MKNEVSSSQKGSAKSNYDLNVWYVFNKVISRSIDPYTALLDSFKITHITNVFIIRNLNSHISSLRQDFLRENLRGSLSKSGPLNFATKIVFLYFLSIRRLQQVYTKIAIFVFKFLFLALLPAKNELTPSRLPSECLKD